MLRGTHTAAILGPELYSRLPNTRILLVGAGGIGCELCRSPLSHDRDVICWIASVALTDVNMSNLPTSKERGHDRVRGYHSPGP